MKKERLLSVFCVVCLLLNVVFGTVFQVNKVYADFPRINLLSNNMDTGFTNGINPFTLSANTDGAAGIVQINGNNALRLTEAATSGNSLGSSITYNLGATSNLVSRINQIYSLPAGSDPVYLYYEFKVERTSSAGTSLVGSTASIQFGNFGTSVVNGVTYTVPRFPVGEPTISTTTPYLDDEPEGSEVMEAVTYKDIPTFKFAIIPNGGSRLITGATLAFTSRVNTGGGIEAYAIDDLGVYEAPENPTSLSIDSQSYTLISGETHSTSLTATLQDGTTSNVTTSAKYFSSNTDIFTVSSAGVVTAVGAGTATLTASYLGISKTVSIVVTPLVTGISTDSGAYSMGLDAVHNTTVTASYQDGTTQNVTALASYSSSNQAAAVVNSTGTVTGVGAGTSVITVTYKGYTQQVNVTVLVVASIAVDSNIYSLPKGMTHNTIITATYTDNSTTDISSSAQYVSSDPSVAEVNAAGIVTANAEGTVTVTVSYKGLTQQIAVTVLASAITSIALDSNSYMVNAGTTKSITITGTYSDASTANLTSQAQFVSSNTSVATVNASGVITGVDAGSTSITATLGSLTKSVVVSVARTAITGNLVGYWDFDQISGNTVYDLSGNGNNGTVYNGTFAEQGRLNGAINLSGLNSYVDCGLASNIDYSSGFTITAWVKPTSQVNSRFISQRNTDSTVDQGAGGYDLGFEAGISRLQYEFSSGTTMQTINTYEGSGAKLGHWSHFAIAYEPAAKHIFIYRNGTQIKINSDFKGPLTKDNLHFLIGALTSSSLNFQGLIDEVRIYNKPVSVADVYNNLPDIHPDSISLDKSTSSIPVGSSVQLTETITPWNSKNLSVIWTSSNPVAASVDDNGLVTALSTGNTTITATTVDGNKTATCDVSTFFRYVSGISLNKISTSIELGKIQTLQATIAPSDASNKFVTWTSSNPDIASVDAAGIVKATGIGTAVITVTTQDGNMTASCTVNTWSKPATGITLNKTSTTISIGDSETLIPTITPSDATNKELIWSSSDNSIAVVSSLGVVTGIGMGTATITATTKDGTLLNASCSVQVTNLLDGIWSKTFIIKDYMNIYDFPEEIVKYDVVFPDNIVHTSGLKLYDTLGASLIPYQLSNKVESNGYLKSATISFRTGLARNSVKSFVLNYDPLYTANFTNNVTLTDVGNNVAVVASNLQQIKVPYGNIQYTSGKALSEVLAPIIAVSRDNTAWCGAGSFEAPSGVLVNSIYGRATDQGPLFIEYTIDYTLNNGRTYKAVLTIRHNEKYVTIDEYLNGFASTDNAFLRFSYKNGVDPEQRLVLGNAGYNQDSNKYCGAYDSRLGTGTNAGRLPYALGIYSVNSTNDVRSTTFWKDSGDNALLFSTYNLRNWKTDPQLVWNSQNYIGDLYFFSKDSDKYLRTGLVGNERHWAMSLIPRSEAAIVGASDKDDTIKTYLLKVNMDDYYNLGQYDQYGSGPDVKLFQKLTDFSLNKYKDMVFDFNETLTPYDTDTNSVTQSSNFYNMYLKEGVIDLTNRFWDVSAFLGGAAFPRTQATFYPIYGDSRSSWSEAQRLQIRSILVFLAYLNTEDTGMPHTSMIGGHPNFIMDGKQGLALACAIFPNHPDAQKWKSEFMNYYNKWISTYSRADNTTLNTKGGRWTENVACYSMASLRPLYESYVSLKKYDNTDLFDRVDFRAWIQWIIAAMVPTEGGIRQVPPQGAHAADKDLPGGEFQDIFDKISAAMINSANPDSVTIGNKLLWCRTKGIQGINPQLQSGLFTDYGAVMRYDFNGPHEAYVNLQELYGMGYRWTAQNNGEIIYASKGKRWSWNDTESTGDNVDLTKLSIFTINGNSIGEHITNGVLYDFDFAQYYKADVSDKNSVYLSRSVMMLRDDYLAIYDDLANNTYQGTFYWNNSGANYTGVLPKIYNVKAGAGDNLHIVAPYDVTVVNKAYGAEVTVPNGTYGDEYVFNSDTDSAVTDGSAVFNGKNGYASNNQLAIFSGTKVGFNDFVLECSGGDFGVSAKKVNNNRIEGRIAGESGGVIMITPPAGFGLFNVVVTINGQNVSSTVQNGVITFNASIAQSDGYKSFVITSSTQIAVSNGDFEAGNTSTADSWNKTTWAGYPQFTRGTDYAHGGNYSVKIINSSNSNGGWSKLSTNMITVAPNTTYTIGAWIKTDTVSAGTGEGVYLSVQFYDSAGNAIGTAKTSDLINGTIDWSQKNISLTAPSDAASLRIDLRLKGTGTAWFDDVNFTQYS